MQSTLADHRIEGASLYRIAHTVIRDCHRPDVTIYFSPIPPVTAIFVAVQHKSMCFYDLNKFSK
jgi:hypothetical protein